jgi:hypothetical protein
MKIATTLLLGIWLALAGAGEVRAQCSKRILVYVDTSGSMLRASPGQPTPYRRTLDSLQLLLEEKDFIESGDVVEIKLFGETVTPSRPAQGRDEALARLDSLRSGVEPAQDTNFEAVFTDVEAALAASSAAERKVVIIASDFVHDPASTPPVGPKANKKKIMGDNQAAWRQVFSRQDEELKKIFGTGSKVPLVLFVAPRANPEDETVAGEVLANLSSQVPDNRQLSVGGEKTPEDLAGAIKHALLYTLGVNANLKKGETNKLQIRVENRNCVPLKLAFVRSECPTGKSESDGVTESIPAEHQLLAANSENKPQIFEVSAPTALKCDGDEYVVKIMDSTGKYELGSTEGTKGTWLEFNLSEALIEQNLVWGGALHVILDLKGLAVAPRNYSIKVSLESDPENTISTGVFTAPDSLEPDNFRPYRATFRIPESYEQRLGDDTPLRIEIPDSRSTPDAEGSMTVKPVEDAKQSRTNAAQLLATPVALVFWVISLVKRRSLKKVLQRGGEIIAGIEALNTLLQSMMVFLPWITSALRAFLVRTLDLLGADAFKWASLFTAAFLVVAILWRVIEQARLERDVVEGRLNDINRYVARVGRGWWPWGAGIGFCILLFIVIYFFIPEGARSVSPQIQALHVTAG